MLIVHTSSIPGPRDLKTSTVTMQLYHQIRRRYQSFCDPLHNEPFSCQGLLPEIAYGIHSIFPVQQESPFNEASKYPLHTLLRSPRLSFNSFGVRSMEDLAEAWERARRGAARGQRSLGTGSLRSPAARRPRVTARPSGPPPSGRPVDSTATPRPPP